MRRWCCIAVATALWAPGCGGKGGGASKQTDGSKTLTIAVIPKGTSHEFWRSVHAGAVKAENELKNIHIEWKGPSTENDANEQIRLVEDFISRRVDGIVLAPADRTSLVRVVDQARKKKIPVVIIDSGIESTNIDSYVATDNSNGGKLAGEYMGKLLGGKGNVLVLRYQVGSESTEKREDAFIKALEAFPNIKLMPVNKYAGANEAQALQSAEDLLTLYGDKIDGWFCSCEPVTSGTVQALKNRKLAGKVKVIGFDGGAKVFPAFKEGRIQGLILQDPINIGYLGVKSVVAAAGGKALEPIIGTGETLVTQENFNEPKIQALCSTTERDKLLKE